MSEKDRTSPDTDAFGRERLFTNKYGWPGRTTLHLDQARLYVSPIGSDEWVDMGDGYMGPVSRLPSRIERDEMELGRVIREYVGQELNDIRLTRLLGHRDRWPLAPMEQVQRQPWADWYDRMTRPAVTVRWRTWYAGLRWSWDSVAGLWTSKTDRLRARRYADWVDGRYQADRVNAQRASLYADLAEHERGLWERLFENVPKFTVPPEELDGSGFTDVMGVGRYQLDESGRIHQYTTGRLTWDELDRLLANMYASGQQSAEAFAEYNEWTAQEVKRRLDRWYPGWKDAFEQMGELDADTRQAVRWRASRESGADAQPGPVALPVRDPQAVRPQVGRHGGGGAGAEDGVPQPAAEEGCP